MTLSGKGVKGDHLKRVDFLAVNLGFAVRSVTSIVPTSRPERSIGYWFRMLSGIFTRFRSSAGRSTVVIHPKPMDLSHWY